MVEVKKALAALADFLDEKKLYKLANFVDSISEEDSIVVLQQIGNEFDKEGLYDFANRVTKLILAAPELEVPKPKEIREVTVFVPHEILEDEELESTVPGGEEEEELSLEEQIDLLEGVEDVSISIEAKKALSFFNEMWPLIERAAIDQRTGLGEIREIIKARAAMTDLNLIVKEKIVRIVERKIKTIRSLASFWWNSILALQGLSAIKEKTHTWKGR